MRTKTKSWLVRGGAALAALSVAVLGLGSGASAAPNPPPPSSVSKSAPQVAAATQQSYRAPAGVLQPGDAKVQAKALTAKGATGALRAASKFRTGYVPYTDFTAFSHYCWEGYQYTPVYNNVGYGRYIQVRIYTQGSYREFNTYVAHGSYVYPYFYGMAGAYTAYLYVWNGSYYAYDEAISGNHNCNVGTTLTKVGAYALLTMKNYGNAYATVRNSMLAPYAYAGTYTGTHYDYPAINGGVAYRYKYVGSTYTPYGINVDVEQSFLYSTNFAGYW